MKKAAKKAVKRVVRRKPQPAESHLEEKLLVRLLEFFPPPLRNYCPFTQNKLEFDFTFLTQKIALEVQGGISSRNRRSGHVSIDGMHRDIYKMCMAQSQGWILYQVAPIWITCDNHWQSILLPFLIKAFKLRTPT